MEKNSPRRTGSREVVARYLTPASPEPALASSFGGRASSPLRRKPAPDGQRKRRAAEEAAPTRGLWPSSTSSSSKKPGTLADHLGNDCLIDLVERRNGELSTTATPQSVTLQRGCSELGRFEGTTKEDRGRRSKENRPIGGSLRYPGKLRFPPSVNPGSPTSSSSTNSSLNLTPGRNAVDENAHIFRRKSDLAAEFPSSESDRSEPRYRRDRHHDTKSAEEVPTPKMGAELMRRRSTSYRSVTPVSPGRPRGSPPAAQGNGRSFSTLRPSSPSTGKGRGVGNFISLGLDLFMRKSSGSGNLSSSSSPLAVASSPATKGVVVGEMGHQLRLLHNRLIQWRYVNARSDAVNRVKWAHSEGMMLRTWASVPKLQASVAQKKVQLKKEKMGFKLNTLLSSQMKALERWSDMERQHSSALFTMKNCLQSQVCRLPLVDGAQADPQPLYVELRRAADLTTALKTAISTFSPTAQHTVPLLVELAQVVSTERSILDECFELLHSAATLQLQEQSLKCHLIQLISLQQQQKQLQLKNP